MTNRYPMPLTASLVLLALTAVPAAAVPDTAVPDAAAPDAAAPVKAAPPAVGAAAVTPAGGLTVKLDPELPAIEIPPEILEQLEGMARDSDKAMAAVNELLAQDLEKIQNAEAIFDTMIKTIRDAAANGAPESEFVKRLEDLAKQARADAAAAKELQDTRLASQFQAFAAGFEEAKGEAISFYTNSFRNVREIEREKRRFVLAVKVKQYALAKQNVEQGLELLKELNGKIREVRNALPDVPVESQ